MLRVVIDTNVIISALTFGGNPKAVLELARKRHIRNTTSTFIIEEIGRVAVIKNLPDNRILECAVAGGVDYLISGDHHLTDLKNFGTIKIVTPTEFLAIFYHE
jgi:predicted nucleic acid-binding protein